MGLFTEKDVQAIVRTLDKHEGLEAEQVVDHLDGPDHRAP